MTAALILAAVIVSVGATVAVLYPRHAEDRRDADEAFDRAERLQEAIRRTWKRLRVAKARPAWLPEPTRAGDRFVARHPDDPRRRLDAVLGDWRETARRRSET